MKRAVVGVVIVVAAVVVWRWWHREAGDAASKSDSAAVGSSASARTSTRTSKSTSKTAQAPAHVTQLAPDERKRIADAIALHHSATPRPELPAAPEPELKTSIRDAMREVIPFLAECYDKALPTLPNPHLEVAAHLTLTGDPDVGTLIDADQQLVDKQTGRPLPRDLDDCLRSTMQTLELPALSEGDVVTVTYPFVFDTAPP
jgi:hypothetical protein